MNWFEVADPWDQMDPPDHPDECDCEKCHDQWHHLKPEECLKFCAWCQNDRAAKALAS